MIYAGTYGDGVFVSLNDGASWHQVNVGLTNLAILALVGSDTNLFAGTNAGVFHSTNGGANWTAADSGRTNTQIQTLAFSGANLYAGIYGSGVFRRALSEMITSVDPWTGKLPHEFVLQKNYPNPFNPSTTISYGVPYKSNVSLVVYNALGQHVATLVQGDQEAGYYKIVSGDTV